MPTYATPDDLAAYVPTVPANAEVLLSRAQRMVDEALATCSYQHDDTGMPTDPAVLTALKAATCEQVAYWLAIGSADGLPQAAQAVSLGGVSITREYRGAGDPALDLAQQAALALRGVPGIYSAGPWY